MFIIREQYTAKTRDCIYPTSSTSNVVENLLHLWLLIVRRFAEMRGDLEGSWTLPCSCNPPQRTHPQSHPKYQRRWKENSCLKNNNYVKFRWEIFNFRVDFDTQNCLTIRANWLDTRDKISVKLCQCHVHCFNFRIS